MQCTVHVLAYFGKFPLKENIFISYLILEFLNRGVWSANNCLGQCRQFCLKMYVPEVVKVRTGYKTQTSKIFSSFLKSFFHNLIIIIFNYIGW
jgi:hypothetical protein